MKKLLRYLCCLHEREIHHLIFSICSFYFFFSLLSINRICHLVTAAAAGLETEPENPGWTSAKVGQRHPAKGSNRRCPREHRRISENVFPSGPLMAVSSRNNKHCPAQSRRVPALTDASGLLQAVKKPQTNAAAEMNTDTASDHAASASRPQASEGGGEEEGGKGGGGDRRESCFFEKLSCRSRNFRRFPPPAVRELPEV